MFFVHCAVTVILAVAFDDEFIVVEPYFHAVNFLPVGAVGVHRR